MIVIQTGDSNKMAVVKGSIETGFEPVFKGNRDECYAYMRTHKGWDDLVYVTATGFRMSSWIL